MHTLETAKIAALLDFERLPFKIPRFIISHDGFRPMVIGNPPPPGPANPDLDHRTPRQTPAHAQIPDAPSPPRGADPCPPQVLSV